MRKRFLVKVGIKRFNTLYATFLVLACIAGVEWGRGLGEREKGRGIGGEDIKGTFLSFPFRAFLLLQLPLPLPLPPQICACHAGLVPQTPVIGFCTVRAQGNHTLPMSPSFSFSRKSMSWQIYFIK